MHCSLMKKCFAEIRGKAALHEKAGNTVEGPEVHRVKDCSTPVAKQAAKCHARLLPLALISPVLW